SSSTNSATRHPTCAPTIAINPANVIINTGSVEVITALSPGVDSVNQGGMPASVSTGATPLGVTGNCPGGDNLHANCGVSTVFTNRTVPKAEGSFTVTEGHNYAWFNNSTTQFAGAGGFTKDAGFRLTFSGLPAGVTLTLAVAAYNTSSAFPNSDPQLSRT